MGSANCASVVERHWSSVTQRVSSPTSRDNRGSQHLLSSKGTEISLGKFVPEYFFDISKSYPLPVLFVNRK
jgi:hypothetical protein